jgi:general stress protein 26
MRPPGTKPARPSLFRPNGPFAEKEAMADEPTDRVWELMDKIGTCMLVTHKGGGFHARPMSAIVKPDEDAIYFLTDVSLLKDDEIRANPDVALTFADTGSQKYVSLTGHGEVSDDRDKIHELWSPFAKAFWESPDDPKIRLLRVTPSEAEFWDSRGAVATYVSMLAAAVIGTKPAEGDNEKVAM